MIVVNLRGEYVLRYGFENTVYPAQHIAESSLSLVYVRYKDQGLFKDSDASQYQPWTRECVGWLDYEDEEYIRIVWERYSEPDHPGNSKLRSTGLAILRKAILEIKGVGQQ